MEELLLMGEDSASNRLICKSVEDLKNIHHSNFNLAILERESLPEWEGFLVTHFDLLPETKLYIDNSEIPERLIEIDRLFHTLPSPWGALLSQEIKKLLSLFSFVNDQEGMEVVLTKETGPKTEQLHRDKNHLRMFCSFLGAGITWADTSEKKILNQTNCLDIVVLKGDFYPGNEEKGILYQLPLLKEEEQHYVLRIDSMDW